jgi:hypothetical protein
VFSPEAREQLRNALVAAAQSDPRIIGAAVTGSAAVGREDQWSDIDFALSVAPGADRATVVADWSARMYGADHAVDHVDVTRGEALFRVFLLASTLQVDIAFWPAAEFGAFAPTFRLLFGTAHERPPAPAPLARDLIGFAWLHALHARSSIARHRAWQAEYMVSVVRDHVLALMCLRHGVPAMRGRGMDDLPSDATAGITGSLVRSLDGAELSRAFRVVSEALLVEIEWVDPQRANRLAGPLRELVGEEQIWPS